MTIAYYYKNDKQNAKKYLDQAKLIRPVLYTGVEGLELEKEGISFSEKDSEALKIIFEEFK